MSKRVRVRKTWQISPVTKVKQSRKGYSRKNVKIEIPDLENENHGMPGDGSGVDDLADFNQNEADDYRDE